MAPVVKNLSADTGDVRNAGLIPVSGRSPGEGNGNPLWYSCLENPMDRGAWQATVHRVLKSQMWLSQHPQSYKGGPTLRTTSSLKYLLKAHILCLVTQSCPTLCDPMDHSSSGSFVHVNSPSKIPESVAKPEGIFPTQGWKPGFPHCRQILYCLSHQESLPKAHILPLSYWG